MAKNSISVMPDSENNGTFLIQFEKERFDDFLSALMTSPREEKRSIALGFDITPADLKIIIEKLNHHISTQGNLLTESFNSVTKYIDNSETVCQNIGSFIHIDNGLRPNVKSFTITLTYMVGFSRGENISYERQVVSISTISGRIGRVEISVRATEITWSRPILDTIESEVRRISKFTSNSPNTEPKYLQILKILRNITSSTKSLEITFLLILASIIGSITYEFADKSEIPYIYNASDNTVSSENFRKSVDLLGWRAASDLALRSEPMYKSGLAVMADDDRPVMRLFTWVKSLFSWHSLIIGLLVCGALMACLRTLAFHDCTSVGRLFLDKSEVTARPKPSPATGLIISGYFAIVCSVIASFLTSLV